VRVDLWIPTANPYSTPELLALIGEEAEARASAPCGSVSTWCSSRSTHRRTRMRRTAASRSRRNRAVGALVGAVLPRRPHLDGAPGHGHAPAAPAQPVYTAKEISTLDWLSGGRVDLGVGVGWLREEFEALNVSWPRRGRRTDEYLEVLRTLWCDETSAFEGEFYSLAPCAMFPKPVQHPHPPFHIGGRATRL